MRRSPVAITIAVLLLAAACGDSASIPDLGTEEADTAPTPTTNAPTTDAPDIDDTRATAIAVDSVGVGNGLPLLQWAAVDGAVDYQVIVRDADGNPYWSWIGDDTSVVVGGAERSPSAAGPRVAAGFVWSVAAWDDSGAVLAVSEMATLDE